MQPNPQSSISAPLPAISCRGGVNGSSETGPSTVNDVDHAAFIEDYGAAIEAGQASLLIGAGLSAGAGYPEWAELLQPIAVEFGVPTTVGLPLQAQYIEQKPGGRERIIEHLATAIGAVTPTPLENHLLLAHLGIGDTWTTNYDPLIETADPHLTVIERDADLVERAGRQRRLNKMHGSIPHGAGKPVGGREQLVLSRDDYDSYDQTHPRLWRLLQARFLTSSFLFLGFSMTDPNLDAVFKIARRVTADKLMPHYAIMKRADADGTFDLQADDLRSAGIELIEVPGYDDVTTLLRELVARTRPTGLFVSGSARTPGDVDSTGSGSYPTAANNEELDGFAEHLGSRLAVEDIPSIVAAGDIGAKVGYRFLSGLEEYDPYRFLLVRRRSLAEVTPPSLRQGQILFIGEQPDMLRSAAFAQVRAVVVLGGGPGTAAEAERALEMGMSVVPVGHTGGAARSVWQSMSADLASHHIGQRPINPQLFEELGSTDSDIAMRATIELIRIGLFCPPR